MSLADITGIKALKRRIERRAEREGADPRNVKTGHGGIRDIEFVIQFLQLLNGGALPEVRTGNTLDAIARLEQVGCLTHQERIDPGRELQLPAQDRAPAADHVRPADARAAVDRDELAQARACGWAIRSTPHRTALAAFTSDYGAPHDGQPQDSRPPAARRVSRATATTEPEVDLVLDPDPPPERIEQVLGRYPFRDVPAAYDNLMALATEKIRFLSTRRCRHFLASIAPRLLAAIAATPDPDATLVNLSRVSDSLGGKAALWELFSSNPPVAQSVRDAVRRVPVSVRHPDQQPGHDRRADGQPARATSCRRSTMLEADARRACRTGAEDLDPILHSFKNAQHLRVGVRDILGKDDIRSTHAALSDIAEACLKQIAASEYAKLVEKFGEPTIPIPSESEPPSSGALQTVADLRRPRGRRLRTGRAGPRQARRPRAELSQRSRPGLPLRGRRQHARPAARVARQHHQQPLLQRAGPARSSRRQPPRPVRPAVRSRPPPAPDRQERLAGGAARRVRPLLLATAAGSCGNGRRCARRASCSASPAAAAHAMASRRRRRLRPALEAASTPRRSAQMRPRLEETASARNLKRGRRRHGRHRVPRADAAAQARRRRSVGPLPGTLDALAAFEAGGYLSSDDADYFRRGYRFQRSVEARIRLMNSAGRHEFPDNPTDLTKLAYLLGYADADELVAEAEHIFAENRVRFNRIFDAAERRLNWAHRRSQRRLSPRRYPTTASYDSAGSTKILPSPIRPVRATSTILRTTSSARASSTHSVISTLGRNVCAYSAVGVLVEIALLLAHALHFADAHRFERRAAQGIENLLDEERLHDGDDLFHGATSC